MIRKESEAFSSLRLEYTKKALRDEMEKKYAD